MTDHLPSNQACIDGIDSAMALQIAADVDHHFSPGTMTQREKALVVLARAHLNLRERFTKACAEITRLSEPPSTIRFNEWWPQFVAEHPQMTPGAYEESIAHSAWTAARHTETKVDDPTKWDGPSHVCIDNKMHIGAKERCSSCPTDKKSAQEWPCPLHAQDHPMCPHCAEIFKQRSAGETDEGQPCQHGVPAHEVCPRCD